METSLTTLLAHLGTPILLLDGDGVIRVASDRACELLRVDPLQMEGIRFSELFTELLDELGEVVNPGGFPFSMIGAAGTGECVFGGRRKGMETPCWYRLVIGTPISSDKLRPATLVDISDVMGDLQVASRVFQAKTEWETTVDALEDIVTIQDLEMNIVRANRVAHDLFSMKLGELKGKKCYEVFAKRELPCERCPVVQTGEDGCPHSETLYNDVIDRSFSISSFPIFDKTGRMHQLVHVARDVTSFLKNEKEKNRLMAAIEQASESVMISDAEGIIQYVNPAFEQVSGYSRPEILGRSAGILKSGAHDEEFYAQMWQTLRAGQVWRGKLVNRRKNGTIYREDATISPVFDEAGAIVNFVALKRDVTREELLEKQLHQAMKMEALGTLAGGIAHDFNNILASMIGYSEMAKERLPGDHPARKAVERVLAGGDRAVELVKQILTFSRKEATGQFRVFKLQYVVKEIIQLLRPSLPATIELKHSIDSGCRSIEADPSQIYQVIMNLCTNARQAIGDDHGQIFIGLSEIREEKVDPADEPAGYLDLEVRDTGCGIPTELLDRIFDPFFTTKEKGQGTGLGLAVVHGIIKKHGGEISVTSEEGVGTSFHVYLRVDGREEAKAQTSQVGRRGNGERIMVVEDEPGLVAVLRSILETNGYRVTAFTDSLEAARFFRQNPLCCDLVLTDMLMPKMTGAELSREMLALRPDLSIIMLTGHGDSFDSERARQLGIKEYALKPLRREQLLEVVGKVLEDGKDTDHR